MNKQEFLTRLRCGLTNILPQNELVGRLNFYSEMIDDRMEEGLSEEDAVAAMGSVEEILTQAATENASAEAPKRKLKKWELVLLIAGSPLWLALGLAALAVVLSLYLALWAVVIAFWAVFAALAGSALGVLAGGIALICTGKTLPGIAMIGAALVCAGLSIFAFFGCKAATKGLVLLTKKLNVRKKEKKLCIL